jgi:DNA-binding transcriptional regulator GbsR (MarR family)
MPGGRLSQQERRQIAAGLAAGHGYAEIARGLGRPTSTVTREVGRNGGPRGYQADRAHREAGRRAARRPPGLPAALAEPAASHTGGAAQSGGRAADPRVLHDFQERFAAMMIESGMPRMLARLLVCLFLSETGSLTAAELSQRLQVSPASISKALPLLEQLELARREREPGQRRERYFVDDDVWYRTWTQRAGAMTVYIDNAREGARLLGAKTAVGARLVDMADFLDLVRQDILEGAERWKDFFADRRRARAAGR